MLVGQLQKRVIIKNVIIMGLCVSAGWFLKAKLTPQTAGMMAGQGGAPYVLTQKLDVKNIAPKQSFIGHVEAIKSVNLMPQITGYVEKVLFEEGSYVDEGDILFIIEQERYLANVELRKAELASAQASFVRAQKDYRRQSSLSKQNYASKATLDTAESAYLQAKAAVAQAKANLDLAKINLGYTEIKAPISGRIGKALVTEGNYVSSATQTLARIVQTNPIRVAFSVTDKDILNMRQLYEDKGEKLHTELVLSNGSVLTNNIISRFSDNEVNTDTATIAIYTEYNNDKNLLIPGNYVDIRIGTEKAQMALLVPQAALAQDTNGNYVMVVNQDNIAEQRRVVLGDIIEDKQVVLEGLSAEDKVIIQGLQKVHNGQKVNAQQVKKVAEVK